MDYKTETVGSIMSTRIPVCRLTDKVSDVIQKIVQDKFDSVQDIYVTDGHNKLLGFIDLTKLVQEGNDARVKDVYQQPVVVLHPNADQEKAVYQAVREDVVSIPVTSRDGVFLGAVTAHALIDIMHDEHIEDAMITAGIRSEGPFNLHLLSSRISLLVKSRAPWLVMGLLGGLLLGFISSWFEGALEESIAIAYFIPVIAYVAGSVGAQAGAIAVRTLALMKFDYKRYLYKEFITGIFLGIIVGGVGFLGALLIAGQVNIAVAVALSLIVASMIASLLASLVPFGLKLMNKDPALGSGPIATALLDVISVFCYFLIATSLV